MMFILNRFSVQVLLLCLLALSLVEAHFLEHLMHHLHPSHAPATCKPGCCQGKKCPKPKCHPHQKMKPKAGWCGCCPKCVTQLKMGMSCHPKPKHPCPHMPSAECGCGLKCVHGKCCKAH